MFTLLAIIIVVLLLTGGWGYGYRGWSGTYGYGPGYGLGGILLILIVLWLLLGGAHAATSGGTQDLNTVDALAWYRLIEPYLLSAVQAVILAAIPIFAALLYKFTGIKLQDSDRTAIQTAAANAAGRIVHGIEGPIANINFAAPGKFGAIISAEVNTIRATLPDELDRRGITPDRVEAIVRGKLGQLQNGTLAVPHP